MDLMKFINIKISPERRNQLSILQESSKSANKFVPSNVLIVYWKDGLEMEIFLSQIQV
jgi:hypothetical protein